MFASVKRDEFDARGAAEDLDGADALAVDAGGMGEEPEAFAFHGGKTIGFEDVDAEHDAAGGFGASCGRNGFSHGRYGGGGRRFFDGGLGRAATEQAEGSGQQREQDF